MTHTVRLPPTATSDVIQKELLDLLTTVYALHVQAVEVGPRWKAGVAGLVVGNPGPHPEFPCAQPC